MTEISDNQTIETTTPADKKSVSHYGKKIFWFCFRIALAVGIIYFLVHGEAGKILHDLKKFDYRWLLPAFFFYYIHFMFGAWRWYKLTTVLNINISLRDAIFLSMKAFFFSLVIPGGAIGGDLAKIGFLAAQAQKGTKVEGAFTVLMDRIVGMVSLFALTIVVVLISIPLLMQVEADQLYDMLGLQHSPDVIRTFKYCAIAGLILMCLAGICACAIMFMHRFVRKLPLVDPIWKWCDTHSHGSVSRMTSAIDLYRDKLGLLANLILTSTIFIHLNLVLIVYCITRGLGVTVKPLALLCSVTLGNIAGLLPFTPSGIGFRDYTIIKVLEVGGAPMDAAKSAALLFTALIIVANISAGIFYILDMKKKVE